MTSPSDQSPAPPTAPGPLGGPRPRDPFPPLIIPIAGLILLSLAILGAYSNCTKNAFALDDWHTIQQNPAIRTLDWKHVHQFFTDLNAFSVLPANLDYRPALLVTYAANYQWSRAMFNDGYDPQTWHWFNMVLHLSATVGLFFVGRALIGSGRLSPLPRVSATEGDVLALAAALLFAVHPATSGCVNYISARSSLMVAALLLPAMAIYLFVLARRPAAWKAILLLLVSLVLAVVAMFTKVEAVALLPVLALAEFFFAPGNAQRPFAERPFNLGSIARLALFAVPTALYLTVWASISTLPENAHKAAAGMTRGVYFLTQVRAWWYYVAEVLAPVHLVADESAYPISGGTAPTEPQYSLLRAVLDPRVWLAITGWIGVAALCLRCLRSFPALPFLVAAFILFLAPTSSFEPLAEMVNEHRPYLPNAGLFILGAAALYLAIRALSRWPLVIFITATLLLFAPLMGLTRDRNLVWRDDLSLWEDTATKTPNSARAQMNYGLALMSRGRYRDAEARFRQAANLAPGWSLVYTNLAIDLAAQGDTAGAATHHDIAVSFAPKDSTPFYWRGLFRAKQGNLAGAVEDFQVAVANNPSAFKELAALGESLLFIGRKEEAAPVIARGQALDAGGFEAERESFRRYYLPPR